MCKNEARQMAIRLSRMMNTQTQHTCTYLPPSKSVECDSKMQFELISRRQCVPTVDCPHCNRVRTNQRTNGNATTKIMLKSIDNERMTEEEKRREREKKKKSE